jgi:hypothetical protein
MNFPKIIALAGKKRAGKTLVASYLNIRYDYTVLNFADELKNLVCDITEMSRTRLESLKEHHFDIQIQDHHIKLISERTDIKEESIMYSLGTKRHFSGPRDMLQFLGTDIIRDNNPYWHINALHSKIDLIDETKRYCIADMRFENEKEYLESICSKTVYIQRDQLDQTIDSHVSENNLAKCDRFDAVLYNNRDIQALINNLEVLVYKMSKSH